MSEKLSFCPEKGRANGVVAANRWRIRDGPDHDRERQTRLCVAPERRRDEDKDRRAIMGRGHNQQRPLPPTTTRSVTVFG